MKPKKKYKKMTVAAARRLLVAVIRQAVEDYRTCEKRGLIVGGLVLAPAQPARGRHETSRDWFVGRDECEQLVAFFRPGGPMDQLLAAGRLWVSGDAIRQRLGLLCESGSYPDAANNFVKSDTTLAARGFMERNRRKNQNYVSCGCF